MNYQMLVLDIDDTLLTSERTISERTYDALMDAQKRGVKIVLASGRPTPSMVETARQLKLDVFDSYIISFNGAVVTRMKDVRELFSQRIEISEQRAIIDYLQAQHLVVTTYTDDTIMLDKVNEYSHIEGELTGLPSVYDEKWIATLDTPRLKFIGVGDPQIVKQCETALNGQFGEWTYVTTSKPYFLEMMHKDVSKGKAVEWLCRYLNMEVSQVVACGDGNNDATMIETAGLGIAMGNATDYLKSIADEITLSNDEDGIVAVLEKYFR
ncbi:MAG: Cof-type HAD-IIB family hydrolase [Aerococcaceae bacterium]|nr:Cof-type HAD-IIB family hydrolase [Aerococcaceae bacterium]